MHHGREATKLHLSGAHALRQRDPEGTGSALRTNQGTVSEKGFWKRFSLNSSERRKRLQDMYPRPTDGEPNIQTS
eukprot:6025659-Amphidinium_carterae.1